MNDIFPQRVETADETVRRPFGTDLPKAGPLPGVDNQQLKLVLEAMARPSSKFGLDVFNRLGSPSGMDDDPFGARPAPPGLDDGFGLGAAQPDRGVRRIDPTIERAFELAAINPLVAAASPLLWLAARLNETAPPDNIAEFRRNVLEEIRHFETTAMAKDIPERLVRVTRYALAAVIDDIVLSTRWGAQNGWASGSLVSVLYNETWGGERFYDLLQQLLQQPEQNIDALELMAICMAIGFAGKYRVMDGGQSQLTRLRHDLYRTIRRVRGPYERNLAAIWQVIPAPHRPPISMVAPWLIAGLLLLLLLAAWVFSSISLRASVEQTSDQILSLVPTIPILVERAGIPDIPKPKPPVRKTQLQRISEALETQISDGWVEVEAIGDRIVIRMLQASFPSGGVELSPNEEPLVAAIGGALDPEPGAILVLGHTDDVPVGATSAFGDNMAISVARARSAATMLLRHISVASRVSWEGRGANDPIAPNTSEENRARNRRVEFQIPAEKVQ